MPSLEPHDIASLISRCISGDDAAQAEFIEYYDELIRRSVWRALREYVSTNVANRDVDDIRNDIYLNLFKDDCRALSHLKEPRSICAWLITLSRNRVRSTLRKRREISMDDATVLHEAPAPYSSSPEQAAVRHELGAFIEEGLNAMTAQDRLILQLFYIHNLKYSEIGEILNLNLNTIATRLRRARSRLREHLRESMG